LHTLHVVPQESANGTEKKVRQLKEMITGKKIPNDVQWVLRLREGGRSGKVDIYACAGSGGPLIAEMQK
jgi:hypothetical protein